MVLAHPLTFMLGKTCSDTKSSLPLLWKESIQYSRHIVSVVRSHHCSSQLQSSPKPCFVWPSRGIQYLSVLWNWGQICSSWNSVSLSTGKLSCFFSSCDLQPEGSLAGYPELVWSFLFHSPTFYSQDTQLDQPTNVWGGERGGGKNSYYYLLFLWFVSHFWRLSTPTSQPKLKI